jgi:hypothetical protein
MLIRHTVSDAAFFQSAPRIMSTLIRPGACGCPLTCDEHDTKVTREAPGIWSELLNWIVSLPFSWLETGSFGAPWPVSVMCENTHAKPHWQRSHSAVIRSDQTMSKTAVNLEFMIRNRAWLCGSGRIVGRGKGWLGVGQAQSRLGLANTTGNVFRSGAGAPTRTFRANWTPSACALGL